MVPDQCSSLGRMSSIILSSHLRTWLATPDRYRGTTAPVIDVGFEHGCI